MGIGRLEAQMLGAGSLIMIRPWRRRSRPPDAVRRAAGHHAVRIGSIWREPRLLYRAPAGNRYSQIKVEFYILDFAIFDDFI